jgi:predicted AlkP superfamily phosphohydrolase/phosphomutase
VDVGVDVRYHRVSHELADFLLVPQTGLVVTDCSAETIRGGSDQPIVVFVAMDGASPQGRSDDRMLVIGWDGADWEIINDLLARGLLPFIGEMLADGLHADLESVIPSHSWAAWPTFLTGNDPGGHGVYDFIERDPLHPAKRVPVTSRSIGATTFPEYLSNAGHEVRVGNVPALYPPLPVKGRMISGVAVPPAGEFIYPPEWGKELDARTPFPVNGLEWTRAQEKPQSLIDEARRLLEERTAAFKALLEGQWSVATCVFVEPDRLQHP